MAPFLVFWKFMGDFKVAYEDSIAILLRFSRAELTAMRV